MSKTKYDYPLPEPGWSKSDLFTFRAAAVFFAGLIVPVDPDFYRRFAAINWERFKYHDLDIVANYFPWFANNAFDRDFSGLLIWLALSLAAAGIWGLADRRTAGYNNLRYVLTGIIRLKIAIAMFHFGWVKLFPLQMPYPSLSQLNTNLGDFTPGKLYWVHIGAVPAYEIFIGSAELLAAVLIFFRRTSVAGLLILVAILIPVLVLNITYDAGVQLKAASLLLMGGYLLAPNLRGLYAFIVDKQPARLVWFRQFDEKPWHRYGKLLIKAALFAVFFGLYGAKAGQSYFKGESHMRRVIKQGLARLEGVYDVSGFVAGRDTLPYSLTDTLRWDNVIFEKWNTVSIRQQRPVSINLRARNTELFATVGRHYYSYTADTLARLLFLESRTDTSEKFTFSYSELNDGRLLLSGIAGGGDSLHVQLTRLNRQYPLFEGRVEKTYIP